MKDLTLKINETSLVFITKEGYQIAKLFFHKFCNTPPNPEYRDLLSLPYISIARLIVTKEYRRKKYATELFNKLFELNKDVKSFIISANPDNPEYITKEALLRFYESFGFKRYKETEEGTILILNK